MQLSWWPTNMACKVFEQMCAEHSESRREPQPQAAFLKEEPVMFLSSCQREQVAGELKRFATELNLSEDQ